MDAAVVIDMGADVLYDEVLLMGRLGNLVFFFVGFLRTKASMKS